MLVTKKHYPSATRIQPTGCHDLYDPGAARVLEYIIGAMTHKKTVLGLPRGGFGRIVSYLVFNTTTTTTTTKGMDHLQAEQQKPFRDGKKQNPPKFQAYENPP